MILPNLPCVRVTWYILVSCYTRLSFLEGRRVIESRVTAVRTGVGQGIGGWVGRDGRIEQKEKKEKTYGHEDQCGDCGVGGGGGERG